MVVSKYFLRGGRRHVPTRGKPCAERLRIERSRVARFPRLIDRQAFHHAVKPPECEPQTSERTYADLGNPAVPPVCAVEMHDGVALVVLRIDLHAELAAQREHAILSFAKPRAAHRDDGAVGCRPVPDTAADAITRLKQHDQLSRALQASRSRKAGEPRAHDAIIRLQSFQAVCLPSRKTIRALRHASASAG